MIEIIKKTILAGSGFAHKTWDEVEVLANEVVKKAKMGEKERAKFLKDMKSRYDGTQKKLEKYVEKIVKDILKKMDIATGADIIALKKEIRLLKKANSSAGTPKRTPGKTAKKSTTTGAKKPVARAAAKKRPAAGAKKSTTTVARKRAGTARTPKSTGGTTKK
ncbi:MAG: hypothetical protein V2I56_07985 [Desulfobacteraceae bacterium]|jgi:polyhydroxyalkanoate synthesis regulator phasin|nr:hypothetical protein [Desulfobacteraceae bacterium]